MTYQEFTKLVNKEIDMEDYQVIEFVYTYHPCLKKKEDAANLYLNFGMRLFRDMYDTAEKVSILMDEIIIRKQKIEKLEEEIKVIQRELNKIREGRC